MRGRSPRPGRAQPRLMPVPGVRPTVLASIAMEAVAVVVVVIAAGGGHGTYMPAKIIFPYTLMLTRWTQVITTAGIVVALLQFPLYGLAVSTGRTIRSRRAIIAACALGHAIAGVMAMWWSAEAFTP